MRTAACFSNATSNSPGLIVTTLLKCPNQEGVAEAEASRVMGNFPKVTSVRMNLDDDPQLPRGRAPDEFELEPLEQCCSTSTESGVHRRRSFRTTDHQLPTDGRVMEVLSEHMCEGWLEGYLLTGRHGFFSCYEAFVHIIDSMFNQHAKWLRRSAARIALAQAHRIPELPAELRMSGGRIITASAIRTLALSITS